MRVLAKGAAAWLLALLAVAPAAQGQQPGPAQDAAGVLRGFLYEEPPSLDFQAEGSLAVLQATEGIFSRLIRPPREPGQDFTPDLALRWTVSADGRVVAFDLRRGVRWHDGEDFTAADVTATFARVLDSDFNSPRCGAMLRPVVEGVKAEGSHRAVFRLRYPAPELFPALASGWCAIAPAHVLGRDGALATAAGQIGTGPFRLKRWEPGRAMVWERNPDYYQPGRPLLSGVSQAVLPGRGRQVAAAEAGAIDLWGGWPPLPVGWIPDLRRELGRNGARGVVEPMPLNAAWTVVFNTRKAPFDDPVLRKAVSLALDRQALFQQAYGGEGVPCAVLDPAVYGEFALGEAQLANLPGCRQPKTADLARARQLVAAKHPKGLEVEIAVRLAGDYAKRTHLVAAALEQINIKPVVKAYGSEEGYRAFRAGRFDLIAAQDTILPVADPGALFLALFDPGSIRNWSKWEDRTFARLLYAARTAAKEPARVAAYRRLQTYLLAEDTGAVIVGWRRGGYFRSARVVNHHPGPGVFDWFDLEGVSLAPGP